MSYNEDSLWIPSTFTELETRLKDKYNEAFNTNHSINEFRETNVFSSLLPWLQLVEAEEILMGQVYNQAVQWIKNSSLQHQARGTTVNALESILLALDFVDYVAVATPNSYPLSFNAGECGLYMKYDNTPENNQTIADTLGVNATYGISYLGNISGTYVHPTTNHNYLFSWSESTPQDVKVKLYYKYDSTFTGIALTQSELVAKYVDVFNNTNKSTQINPRLINQICNGYLGMQYIDTEFSFDGGTIYSPRNELYVVNYDQIINNITIVDVIANAE